MFNYTIIDHFIINKEIHKRRYVCDYMYHRLYGPAYLEWYPNGALYQEEWRINGKRHRGDGPAWQSWYDNGTLTHALWFIDGKQHREDGPAWQCWYEDGTPYYALWFIDGKQHRGDGPAYLEWRDKKGYLVRYYIYGIEIYGIEITEEIQEWAIATGIKDIMMMTPDELVLFKVTWVHK